MDRTAFEAELQRDGYQVVSTRCSPTQVNPGARARFDARLMVVAGEMTVISRTSATPTASATRSA